jgi:hypothetical protein
MLQFVTQIVPATYYIDILNGLFLRNVGMAYLWPSFACCCHVSRQRRRRRGHDEEEGL